MTDLTAMLSSLEPVAREGEFVVVSVEENSLGSVSPAATVLEAEGLTAVLYRSDADELGLRYDYIASWITLSVHSALEAVGLTAAFSSALADEGISCNVLAGFHHDHLLVPSDQREAALQVLRSLGASGKQ